ncbi:response regulator [Flavobacterium sp. DG2-3]|uniref:response regulator n=1 Tax=Flavobacterium sp. DG2-3 TaxID=3068317 RepID=UPI00273EAC9C|nr:response regulator [Flavobacterium sp. DG2-3]MDP5202314.1 response regulator [Flavobacterium sp. DG2-3]
MSKKIILLADDDRDDTEMFCEALADIDENIICHCAENGDKALKMLKNEDKIPGVVFLDLNMPILNGWECLKELKADERYKEIPVIMISTSSHKNDMDTAANLGAVCYFVKPNNFNDLKQVLQFITSNLEKGLKEALPTLEKNKYLHVFSF